MTDGQPAFAQAFLLWLAETGPWDLSALDSQVDGSSDIVARETLYPDNAGKLKRFVEHATARRWNLYYTANQRAPGAKGRKKTDMALARCLYVDVDVRKDEAFQDGKTRIRRVMEALPVGLPRPSALVDTVGGYQAFWKLREPFQQPEGGEWTDSAYERHNRTIEAMLDGDHCHSVDHLFRLPGAINFGKPAKFRRHPDRPIDVVQVCWAERDLLYALTDFPAPAAPKSAPTSGGQSKAKQSIALDVPAEVGMLEELPTLLQDDTRYLIQHGHDEGMKWGTDRSRYLWRAVNDMVRAGVPDADVMAILLDKRWPISSSIVDRPDARHYAEKQIRDAKAASIHPALGELNARYMAVMNHGGHFRIMEMDPESCLPVRSPLAKRDFTDGLDHRMVVTDDEGSEAPMGTWWTRHPLRNTVKELVFKPGQPPQVNGEYNLHRGFSVRPTPGDLDARYLDHLREIVCSGNDETYEYLMNWMARSFQRPDLPGQIAVVMQGKPATGKGTVAQELVKLHAPSSKHVYQADRIAARFNSVTSRCVFMFLDEAVWSGDKRTHATLKGLVTEAMNEIERKFGEATTERNYLHFMIASNDEHVVHMEVDDRRYLVVEVSDKLLSLPKDVQIAHIEALKADMDAGGRAHLLHRLLTRDLSKFNVWSYPRNAATRRQAFLSGDIMIKWIYQKLEDQRLTAYYACGWTDPVPAVTMRHDYLNFAKMRGLSRSDTTRIGIMLNKMFPTMEKVTRSLKSYLDESGLMLSGSTHCYMFPPLEECRRNFEAMYGTQDWSAIPEVVYDADANPRQGVF